MTTMARLLKRRGALNETKRAVQRCVKVAYVKVIEWRLITSDPTGPDHSLTVKLVWLVVSKIAHGNQNVLS